MCVNNLDKIRMIGARLRVRDILLKRRKRELSGENKPGQSINKEIMVKIYLFEILHMF